MDNKKNKPISRAVVNRLPRYFRYLTELLQNDKLRISSGELSRAMNVTASQIRQDLNCFGGFGQQGYGYNVKQLHSEISNILGVYRKFKAVIIGTGNLGKAMANSGLFVKRGVELMALFDNNPDVVGTNVNGFTVMDIAEAGEYIKREKIEIAVLSVPKEETKKVACQIAEYGVRGFWNFSNMELELGMKDIKVQNIHMGDSLMTLCYELCCEK